MTNNSNKLYSLFNNQNPEFQNLLSNLTNPTLLFFVLGMTAFRLNSDLGIPESSSKFISL